MALAQQVTLQSQRERHICQGCSINILVLALLILGESELKTASDKLLYLLNSVFLPLLVSPLKSTCTEEFHFPFFYEL